MVRHNRLEALAHDRRDAIGDSPVRQRARESELEREHSIEGTRTIRTVTTVRRQGSGAEGVTAR